MAQAVGLPVKEGKLSIPSKSQMGKRRDAAGAPLHESLFVLVVLQAIRRRLIGVRDLIIDRTYAAVILVGLAAQQVRRFDLIRSPKRVQAHVWEEDSEF